MNDRILIIGSGQAGITLARELRKLDKAREILVITADDGNFYAKPNLSNAFALNKSPGQLVVTPVEKLAAQLGIEIRPHTRVTAIDSPGQQLLTETGSIDYGQLVLAVGAESIRPPLAGEAADEILTINTLDDYARFREHLTGRRSVALIGGGLIGCEFANDLRIGGFEVQVFDIAPQLLGGLLPPDGADFLRKSLAAQGIVCHLSCRIISIERQEAGYRLHDALGASYCTDLVVSAIGLRPRLALAKSAGVATDRGILTDRQLRTSVANIYALGDCVEIAGEILPYILPIMHGARALARTLLGQASDISYPAMPIAIKTPACPSIVCSPPQGMAGSWKAESGKEYFRALFAEATAETINGFVLLGNATREQRELTAGMPPRL